MSDVQAVPAGAVMETFKKVTEHKVVKKAVTKQHKIASLANSDGFKELVEAIDDKIEWLKNIPVNPSTDTPESVGFRFLASKIAIEALEEIRDMPQRYKEMEKEDGEDGK